MEITLSLSKTLAMYPDGNPQNHHSSRSPQGGEISGHLDGHKMAMISEGGLWMFSCHQSYGGAEVVCYQVLQCCSTKVVPLSIGFGE